MFGVPTNCHSTIRQELPLLSLEKELSLLDYYSDRCSYCFAHNSSSYLAGHQGRPRESSMMAERASPEGHIHLRGCQEILRGKFSFSSKEFQERR